MHFLTALVAFYAAHIAAHGTNTSPLARRAVEEHQLAARDSLASCEPNLYDEAREEHLLTKREAFMEEHLGEKPSLVSRLLGKRSEKLVLRDLDGTVGTEMQKPICILTPEVTSGPFYNTDEKIRPNISEGQKGVPVVYEFSVVDVKTCRPVKGAYVEIWHANATGKYSGEEEEGTVGLHFARGLFKTDNHGVIHMRSIFPCWYEWRATHVHVAVHLGGQRSSKNELENSRIAHIGQVFFPETLLAKIDKLAPYTSFPLARLPNNQDDEYLLTNVNGYSATSSIKTLGSNLNKGIIASIQLAVDMKANYTQTLLAGLIMA